MFKSFTELPVWNIALKLSGEIFNLTVELPKSEDYGLTSQIRRSSNSVSANIAEAFGRATKKDKRTFYILSRASAFETKSHLLYGSHIGYFNNEKVKVLSDNYDELIFDLNKIIKSLS